MGSPPPHPTSDFVGGLAQELIYVVFNYQTFGFEVWLAARNRKVQREYWELLSNTGYRKHQLVEPAVGIDAIATTVLAADYSMKSEDTLTEQIVEGVTVFGHDIESYLSEVDVR